MTQSSRSQNDDVEFIDGERQQVEEEETAVTVQPLLSVVNEKTVTISDTYAPRSSFQKRLRIRKSSKSKQTNLDYILSLIGSFGLYQKLQFIFVGFLAVVPAMAAYSYVFVAATPKFTCKLASEKQIVNYGTDAGLLQSQFNDDTDSEVQLLTESISLFRYINTERLKPNESFYDNSCQLTVPDLQSLKKNNTKIILKCIEWKFDPSVYGRTITTEWNLVCLRSYLKALTQNAYIIGTACAIFSGIMSDKFGRKTTMMLLITLMAIVLNVTQLLMHHSVLSITEKFTIFTISRFLQGFGQTMYSVSFVLLMEITGPENRVLAGNIMAYSFAIGQMVLVLLAYYLRDWRKIMWSLAFYVMPFFSYYWLVPESPRWLLNKDRVIEAKHVLKKISFINNTYNYYMAKVFTSCRGRQSTEPNYHMENYLKSQESSVYIHTLLQEEANKLLQSRKTQTTYSKTLIGITRSRILLKRCFILFYIWMIILMVYLGIGMGMSNAMDKYVNPYLIFFVQAAFEFLGIVTCHLVLNRYGRKTPLIVFMFLAATVIFLIPVFYNKYPMASGVFYLIAKYAISGAQLTCMIFTSELYPTAMRGTGVGLSACISRLGGVWAPQINVLSSTLGFYVPYMVFSSFSLIAAFVAFFLPETLNKSLPENITEAEKMDRKDSSRSK